MIKYTGVTLPEQRVKLYELYLQALIESWNQARSLDDHPVGEPLSYEQTVAALAPLALWLRRENPEAGLAGREQLLAWLKAYYQGDEWGLPPGEARQRAETFLAGVNKYTNLLLERGEGQYGFLHLTLEEMLAAKGLARLYFADPEAACQQLQQYLPEARWRETLQLLVGEIGVRQQLPERAGALLEAILEFELPAGQAVLFAGEALLDTGPAGVSRPAARAVTGGLVELMQAPARPIRARREAGHILGRLGWRPDPAPDDLLLAPAGVEPDGLDAFRYVALASGPMWMGKYPVTNAQFARFIADGGYDQRDFWSDEGWAYRNGANPGLEKIKDKERRKSYEGWLAERPADKRNRPYYWDDTRWNNSLFPVAGLSWFEAEAYAAWLGRRVVIGPQQLAILGQRLAARLKSNLEIRLPAEAEWAAAMGGRGDYPWGDAFDPNHLNCAEAWAGRDLSDEQEWLNWVTSDEEARREATTTAVTTYPQGVSAAGLWDGSGNVWEWQLDIYDPKEQTRTLRGGSWNNNQRNARVSSRNHNQPDNFNNNIGFRVVVVPPLS